MIYKNKYIQQDIKEIINSNLKFEKLKDKSVLITGATGMLATYIVYTMIYLNENFNYNIKIIALVRNKNKAIERFSDILNISNFQLLLQDVCEPIKYNNNIDYILHFAGNASATSIIENPIDIMKTNLIGTYNILEFARKCKVKNILFASTREIYGFTNSIDNKIKEEDYGYVDTLDIRSSYPESKRAAETMLKSYNYQYNIPYVIARIAHSYGPGMNIINDGRVMADFISNVVNYQDIVLKSNGCAVRSFCYITDTIIGIYIIMLEGKIGDAYNIANETNPLPIKEIAQKLINLFPERKLNLYFKKTDKNSNLGYSKIPRVELSTKKIELLGWKPKISIDEGLIRTIMSFKES